jgi:hypothetical protein
VLERGRVASSSACPCVCVTSSSQHCSLTSRGNPSIFTFAILSAASSESLPCKSKAAGTHNQLSRYASQGRTASCSTSWLPHQPHPRYPRFCAALLRMHPPSRTTRHQKCDHGLPQLVLNPIQTLTESLDTAFLPFLPIARDLTQTSLCPRRN